MDCEYNLGEKPFAGYEPNALKKTDLQKDLFGMFARRRATEAELQQGEDEMRRAQRRLDSELASGTEPRLEDVKEFEAKEVYESLRAPKRDEPLGIEDGPKNARKSFSPPVPDPIDQGLAARSSDKHARSPVRAKSELKTPRKTEETPSKRSEGNPPMQTLQIAVE